MTQFKFTVATAGEAGFSSAVLDELDRYYDTLVAAGDLPGHAMLLARGDRIVRGHVTGIERVSLGLFSPERLAPHEVVPAWMRHFAVGLIPVASAAASAFRNPTP